MKMMSTAFVARSELRRRVGSLAVLAAVIAIVVAAVTGALAGARRTTTSIERLRSRTESLDGLFQVNDAGPISRLEPEVTGAQRRIEKHGDVIATGQRWLVNGFFVRDAAIPDIAIYSDPTDDFGRTIDRPRVIEGRMPRRGAPDEIALNEQAASMLDVGRGAVLTLRTWTSENLLQLFGGRALPGFDGPRLHLNVVGVVRTADSLSGNVERGSPYGFAGPRFLAAHPRVGPWPPAIAVRTRGGAAGFARLSRAVGAERKLAAILGTGVSAGAQYLDGVQQGADSSAAGLLVFALISAVAGTLVVGQSVQRHLAGRATEGRLFVELGLTRSATAATLVVPVGLAAAVGAGLGIGMAVLGSLWLPFGVAGRAEIDPGAHLDVPVLLGGAGFAVVLVVAFGFAWARWRIARVRPLRATKDRVSVAGRAALRLGAGPSVATGVQLATDRSSASGPVPIRTAFAGVVLAVAAIVAAGVVVRSDDALVGTPARWGRTWQSEPDAFGGTPLTEQTGRLARDTRLAAAARFTSGDVRIAGRDTTSYALTPIRGRIGFTVVRGQPPTRPDEIALGEGTLAAAHADIGDRLAVVGLGDTGRRADLLVSGTVVIPPASGEEHRLDAGGLTLRRTLSRLVGPNAINEDVVFRYPAGADIPRLQRALAREYHVRFNAFTEPQVPGAVRRLSDTRSVAIALAWFFAALGLLSLVHALFVGTWRRRLQLTVLRVLGMRRSQILTAVLVQAVLLVTLAVVVGIPVGLVVGRRSWYFAAHDLGAVTDALAPWVVIATVLPAAVGAALLVAWWPGARARRGPPAAALQTE